MTWPVCQSSTTPLPVVAGLPCCCAAVSSLRERLLEQVLHAGVEPEHHGVAGLGRGRRDGARHPAVAVDRELLHPGRAAQVLVVAALDAGLADDVVGGVAGLLVGELRLARRAGVADLVGGERTLRVDAHGLGVGRDAGEELGVLDDRERDLRRDVRWRPGSAGTASRSSTACRPSGCRCGSAGSAPPTSCAAPRRAGRSRPARSRSAGRARCGRW